MDSINSAERQRIPLLIIIIVSDLSNKTVVHPALNNGHYYLLADYTMLTQHFSYSVERVILNYVWFGSSWKPPKVIRNETHKNGGIVTPRENRNNRKSYETHTLSHNQSPTLTNIIKLLSSFTPINYRHCSNSGDWLHSRKRTRLFIIYLHSNRCGKINSRPNLK